MEKDSATDVLKTVALAGDVSRRQAIADLNTAHIVIVMTVTSLTVRCNRHKIGDQFPKAVIGMKSCTLPSSQHAAVELQHQKMSDQDELLEERRHNLQILSGKSEADRHVHGQTSEDDPTLAKLSFKWFGDAFEMRRMQSTDNF
eukprot:2604873-Amphidinium_carterae.2